MSSTVTPRKRASNLRMNLDALEEDVLGNYDGQGDKDQECGLEKLGCENSLATAPSGGGNDEGHRVVSPTSDLSGDGANSSGSIGGGDAEGQRGRVGSWGSSSDTSCITVDTTIAAAASGATDGVDTPNPNPSPNPNPNPNRANCPSAMPFSALVPGIQRCLSKVVLRLIGFTARNPPLGDVCEAACGMLVKSFECIALILSEELQRSSVDDSPTNKACQIAVDAATLAVASGNVWKMLAASLHTLSWYRPGNSKMTAMFTDAERQGRLLFMKVSMMAQSLLFDILTKKTQETLDGMLSMEYLPQALPRGPHEGVVDVISFLQAKMETLSALPRSARDIAHFTACTTLSGGLIDHLLSPRVKQINILVLAAIDLDCRRLAQYALSTEIPSLNQCFAETHETVQTILHCDMTKLTADETLRRRLFPRANTSKLIGLLEEDDSCRSTGSRCFSSTSRPRGFAKEAWKMCGSNVVVKRLARTPPARKHESDVKGACQSG